MAERDDRCRKQVQRNDGNELSFEVESIDVAGRGVIGKDVRVPFDDIALIERRRFRWGKTAAAFTGTVLLLSGLFVLAFAAAYGGFG